MTLANFPFAQTATLLFILFVSAVFLRKRQYGPSNLPPGPPRGLFGDNRAQIPDHEPYKKFAEWAKTYGPLFSFYLGRRPVVVLNTPQAASDLLDKRGDIYSSRPRSIMGQEILSANMRGLPMEYGDRWRQWRKGQHACLNAKMSLSYREFQTLESTILLRDLLHDNDHLAHFRRFATSIAFCISYGTRIKNANEKIVIDNQEAAMAFGKTQIPGRFIVESWPFLLWLPKSLQWFRWEQEKRRIIDAQLYTGCLREVKRKVAEGVAKPSMSLKLLEESSSSGLSEMEMAYAAAGPFSAGIPTMLSSLEVFLLAMVLHPECVRKAQEELDHVVGQLRMPTFEDEPSLPYVHALIKETMRWRVITPTAVAHATIAEDVYDGYTIPAGTTVYANVFVISKDPDMFPEPERFRPERFIETSDPRLLDFELPYGFGRRVCPGRFVANQTLFIAIARTLWAFQISPVADSMGKPVLPDPDAFTSGLARRPLPFECVLRPRNGDISKIILADAAHADVALQEWA